MVNNCYLFLPHLYLAPPSDVTPSEFRSRVWCKKTIMMGLPDSDKAFSMSTQYTNVTTCQLPCPGNSALMQLAAITRQLMTCMMVLRFREGLKSLGVLDAMTSFPSVFEPVFCYTANKAMTASAMQELFLPRLSPVGSNKRQMENESLCWWYDFLQNAEGMCTL